MRIKYYFNGTYLIKGRKLFGKIRGIVLSSNTSVYFQGEKVKVDSETFKEVSTDTLKQLKNWGYLSNFDL